MRWACVDVPAWPLQVLRHLRPEWSGRPIAVVSGEDSRARVVWASSHARFLGVRIGMQHAAVRSIAREVCTAPVGAQQLAAAQAELVALFQRYTPRVEPDREHAGVFWLDSSGLTSLFGTLERWGRAVLDELEVGGWHAALVVGFCRWPAMAVAKGASDPEASRGAVIVFDAPDRERDQALQVSIGKLDLSSEWTEELGLLDVRTVGELLVIPRADVARRFGANAARVHEALEGGWTVPFEPTRLSESFEIDVELDPPASTESHILFCAKGGLHVLARELAERHLALATLELEFFAERAVGLVRDPARREVIRPSRPTRDVAAWIELLRLRLASLVSERLLPRSVERLVLRAEPSRSSSVQLSLLDVRSRDPDAFSRGVARLRAAFGDDAVTVPRLLDAWAPELGYGWDPTLPTPESTSPRQTLSFVRRLLEAPRPLEAKGTSEADASDDPSDVKRLSGPYRVASTWWKSGPPREYFYVERSDGRLLWVFRDAGGWFLQATVQ